MGSNQSGASAPPSLADNQTLPPTSHVELTEAGRNKVWVSLLKQAAAERSSVSRLTHAMIETIGDLALQDFSLLSNANRREIIEAACERFFDDAAEVLCRVDNPERLFRYAIRCEVVALI